MHFITEKETPAPVIVPRESLIHAFGGQRQIEKEERGGGETNNPIPLMCSNSIEGLRRSVTHLTAPKVSRDRATAHGETERAGIDL